MSVRNLLRTLSLVIGVSSASLNFAQTAEDDKLGQQLIDAGNRTVKVVIEKFSPGASPELRELLTPQKIRVIVAADFNAFADYKNRRILLPAQFVGECAAQAQAMMLVFRDPSLKPKYMRWQKYLAERSERSRQKFLAGKTLVDDERVIDFWQFARMSSQPVLTDKENFVVEQMMIDALGLVIGHELGHLLLSHKPYREISPATSRRQEFESDEYARKLMKKADMQVLPGLMLAYVRFMQFEGEGPASDFAKSHPPAHCRFYEIGRKELLEMADADGAKEQMEKMGSSVSKIKDLIRALRDECR